VGDNFGNRTIVAHITGQVAKGAVRCAGLGG